ncbi:hypothetical protein HA402_005063 [Bradysia odoriphaga]|nr:hypothetical protein HA402_005063 [Bradysia odoriphaga]
MNSLKLFGACRPTSHFVAKRYAMSQKDRILSFHKEIKSLYGPIIKTKKPKQSKKLSGPSVKHETVSTSAASPALKNPETNYSSEMYWIVGNRWNEIVRKSDAKVGNVSRTFKYQKTENVSSNINTQTSEDKSVKPEKSIELKIVETSAPAIIQKPIPLSNEELKNVLNCPLQSDVLSTTPSDIRAPELRTLPSVGRVLQYTMSEAARSALLNWKLSKISELGEQGFAELQKANLSSGLTFHSSLQQYFLTSEVPTDSSPAFKLWESVRGVLDTFTAMPVSVEKTVHHPVLKYKGICDCVSEVDNKLTIIEWKKSGRSKPTLDATYDAPLQLCAYLGAINCTPEFQGRIRQGMVVIAYENGKQADVYKMDEVMLRNYWLLIVLVSMLLKCQAQNIEFECTGGGTSTLFCGTYTMTASNLSEVRRFVLNGPATTDYAKVTDLSLNHPPLHHFLEEVFTLFPNLQGLYVYSSGSVSIRPYAFQKAKNLVEFSIETWASAPVSNYVFYGATKLEKIELFGVLRIDEFAFAGLTNLNYLYISSSDLGTCPMRDNVFEPLINLKYLEFFLTCIERIPAKLFAKNVNLESVVIWDNIQSVESTFMDNLTNLKNISFISVSDTNSCGSGGWMSPEPKTQFNSDMATCYANFVN